MPQSPQITSRIEAIAQDLLAGLERKDISGKYEELWGVSAKTIDRYISQAKDRVIHLNEIGAIAAQKTVEENAVKRTKNAIKTVEDVDARLSKVIFGKAKLIKSGKGVDAVIVKVENTVSDVIKAIDVYYRRNNYYDKEVIDKSITININGKKIGRVDGSN